MEKVTIKGFIVAHQFYGGMYYSFQSTKLEGDGFVTIMPHEFEVEIPEDFNMTAAMVASLETAKANLRKEFNERIAEINNEISKLQCLEFVPKETV